MAGTLGQAMSSLLGFNGIAPIATPNEKEFEMRLVPFLCTLAALTAPTAVNAQSLDSNATGSMTFTVVIGPIAPAIAAYDDGAAGLWSMAGGTSGLMIKLDESVIPGGTASLSLYTPVNGSEYFVTVTEPNKGRVSALGNQADRGMNRRNYAVNSVASDGAQAMTLLISSL